jgi:hypothetical protein
LGYVTHFRAVLNGTPLFRGFAGGLFDHVGHDVRVRDGDGVRSVDLSGVGVGTIGLELLLGQRNGVLLVLWSAPVSYSVRALMYRACTS